MSSKLYEHEERANMTREAAATKLHALADALAGANSVQVAQGDKDVTVAVPDTVEYEYEIEIKESGKAEIEVSVAWRGK